jgi:mRNA-degrading endonuclease toxin of MazEF toxin-antitoxin module
MQRGEIWAYNPVTTRPQPRLRLIISADAINDASPLLICLQVVEDEDPKSLLAPRVGGVGWAVATLIERTLKSRMTEQVGVATAEEMEQVEIALRAALALE